MIDDAAVIAAVDGNAELVRSVIDFVHAHPELGHEEHRCAAYLSVTLTRAGLDVDLGAGGMETAFRAVLEGGRPGRTVGIVALYDAVPAVAEDGSIRPTHSCGHGPIAGSVVAAAAALAELRSRLAGSIVVIGCPSDEIHAPGTIARAGGKLLSLEAGLWDDVDAALYCHPEFLDTVNLRSLWMRRDRLVVTGTRSLRVDAAQEPLAVLRALLAATESLPPGKLMLEHVTLDGDVEEGTGLYLEATVLLFAENADELAALTGAVRRRGSVRRLVRGQDGAGSEARSWRHRSGRRGVPRGRAHRLRPGPATAALRDRLRQHLPRRARRADGRGT